MRNLDHTSGNDKDSKIFGDIKVFNPDTLLQDMLDADEGTVFVLGEKRIKNHEGDDSVEMTFAQIKRTRDSQERTDLLVTDSQKGATATSNVPSEPPINTIEERLEELLNIVADTAATLADANYYSRDQIVDTRTAAVKAISTLITQARIDELENIRSQQGGHNLDELCCDLCDRIDWLKNRLSE